MTASKPRINRSISLLSTFLYGFCATIFASLVALPAAAVGPAPSEQITAEGKRSHSYSNVRSSTKLDVIIPAFDPNIPENPDDYEKLGVWPELRNAEAKLFALRLRESMENSGVFGAVRVTPNDEALGELYVTGKILKSNSEDVHLEISVQDISQKQWFRTPQKFTYRVSEYNLQSARTKDNDPYAPIFQEITEHIIARLAREREKNLAKLKNLSAMVLARSYSEETFGPYLVERRGRLKLRELPADNDPKFQRALRLKAREDVFIDELQDHYQVYEGDLHDSYAAWQRDSFPEAKEFRLARKKARKERGLGVLTTVASVVLATQADGNDLATAGAIAGGIAGGTLIYKSFRTNADSRVHQEQLKEYGKTLDLELGPKNIEFEGETIELTGTAAEQFQQHRDYLKKWYEAEETPQVLL